MTRTLKLIAMSLAFVGLVAFVPAVHAYELTGGGGKLGVVDPDGRMDGTAEYSAHLEFEEPGSHVHLVPNLTYWNDDGLSDVNPNFDLYYHFVPEGSISPYVGAGMGIHSYGIEGPADGDTDLGANVFGGLRFPGEKAHFFMEGRYVASDLSQVGVRGGVTIH
jgi:hypothetical protein